MHRKVVNVIAIRLPASRLIQAVGGGIGEVAFTELSMQKKKKRLLHALDDPPHTKQFWYLRRRGLL